MSEAENQDAQTATENTEAQTTETVETKEQDESTESKFYPQKETENVDNEETKEADSETESKAEESEDKTEDESKDKDESKDESDKDETVEVKFSDDSELSESDKERIAAFVKEQGLSKEEAENYVKQNEQIISGHLERLSQKHTEMVDSWAEQSKADKEIGGDNLSRSLDDANFAIKKFAGNASEFKSMLDQNGFGSHPEVIRIFSRIGKELRPKAEVSSNQASTGEKSLGELFYGNKES